MAQQLHDASKQLTSKIVMWEGYLDKKGKLNKSWKLRYFILCKSGRLTYYEPTSNDSTTTTKRKKQMGFINLSLATGISTHKYDNTDMVFVIEDANNIESALHAHHSIDSNQLQLNRRKSSRQPSPGQGIEYIMKIYTPQRIWYLRCKQQQSLHEWSTSIKQVIYGNVLYESYLLIKEDQKEYEARWCVLTDKYQLRIYQDETQSKFQQSLHIQQLNMIRHSDPKEAVPHPQNYKMTLMWSEKEFTIATSSHASRDIWIQTFKNLMMNELYTLQILMSGYLLVYTQDDEALSNKKYCVMDSNYHMYFSRDIYTFQRFAHCLYFDIHTFEEEKQNAIDGEVSLLRNKHTFKYGKVVNERMIQLFVVMIQQSDPRVFYIEDDANHIIHFVAASEMELNAWLYCLHQFHIQYCRPSAAAARRAWELDVNIANTVSIAPTQEAKEAEDVDITKDKEKYWSGEWSKMMMKHDGMQTECASMKECPYFERISFLMLFYDDWCCDSDRGSGAYDYLNHSFVGYSTTKLLDDYYHIYSQHTCNDEDFNVMHKQLPLTATAGYNRKCKATMCDIVKRNERTKGTATNVFRNQSLIKMYFGYKDIQQITCIQLMDRIHSVLYHSFDLFRFTDNEQKQIDTQNHDHYCHDDDDGDGDEEENTCTAIEYIDHRFAAMHRIMKSKQKTLISIRRAFDINCNKFVTQIPNDEEEDDDLTPVAVNEHTRCHTTLPRSSKPPLHIQGSKSALVGSVSCAELQSLGHKPSANEFGIGFTYWNNTEDNDDETCTKQKIHIAAKYANLKQEILCNKLCAISRSDWDHTFCAAHNLLLSSYGKQLIADLTESQVAKYKIKDGSAIAINHLQSLLLYCNYGDTLHRYLTRTYSYHKDIHAHSEFANWARYLTECVMIFGSHFVQSSEFYHGLTAHYRFSDFRIHYHYPISVTTKSHVAAQFVPNPEGVVLRLNRCDHGMMSRSKLIDCAFLSDTEYEEEVLLMFDADERPLKITSIVEMSTAYSYDHHLGAMDILEDMINGRTIHQLHELKVKRLHELLQYKIENAFTVSSSETAFTVSTTTATTTMQYIDELFESYCNHQDNLIKFDVNLILSNRCMNKHIASHFVEKEKENSLKIDSLIKLFPNSKAFEIKCPVLHSFIFDAMIQLLRDELIQNIDSKIQQITFKWVNCNIQDIITKYTQPFKDYSWVMSKTTKYGFDYLTIKTED